MTDTLWVHQARPRTPWYGLQPEQKTKLLAQWSDLDAASESAGAKLVGKYSIRGQSDFSTIEIWRFDSPEEAFTFWSDRVAADYAVWFAFSNQVGVSFPVSDSVAAS
jgi:hypothetical protein